MNRFRRVALCAAVPALWAGGCTDFLSGDKLTTDPNRPTVASADQLFVGVQVATFAMFETTPALLTEVWTQQLSGVARQWINFADYNNTEFDPDGVFTQIYGGGGLVDIRRIEESARSTGNDKLLGIAQVYEALVMGTAADWWGDIPYSEAVTRDKPTPKLDPQASVYAAVQQVLDSAIAHLSTGKGFGPGTTDFVYGRDAEKWTRAAHTLKARFYLHVSRGADSTAMFNKAKAEALLGIDSPAGDFKTLHSSAAGETNLFFEFFANTRAGDIDPGGTLIGLLTGAASPNNVLPPDTVLAGSKGYFTKDTTVGIFVGALPDKTVKGVSAFNITAETSTPIITYAENQMILAETQYRTGQQAPALQTLNSFRQSIGESPVALSGVQLLAGILEEKYITNFRNVEVWSDYRRACYPNVQLAPGKRLQYIPARFYYGYTERIANPNIPSAETQAQNPATPNFPKVLKDIFGNTCIGQVNRPGA